MTIVVNARFRNQPLTGVQRYAREVTARLHVPIREEGADVAAGVRGHAWEQFTLPRKLTRGEVLWSPSNTGPLAVRRQVVTIHDMAFVDEPDGFSASFKYLYKAVVPRLARRATAVLTVSEYSKGRIVELCGVDPAKVTAVPNGVSPSFFEPAETDRDAAIKKFGLPPRYVATVGTLQPRKNLKTLLAAWPDVRRHDPGLELAVVGSRERVFRSESYDGDLTGARFLGRLEDAELRGLLTGASGFVFPSRYEGFGLPVLEAMACGCPAACSRASSLPEVGGEFASYFDPDDADAIAATVLEVSGRGRSDAESGRLREYAGRFTWEATAAGVERVLRGVSS